MGRAVCQRVLERTFLADIVRHDGKAADVAACSTLGEERQLEMDRRAIGAGGGEVTMPFLVVLDGLPDFVAAGAGE